MADKTNGFQVPYMIKRTDDKGLGVFAGKVIKQGSIVWRHVPGQYVVYDEQTFRKVIAKMSQAEVAYELTHVFGLNEFPNCLIRILDDGVLINHSSNSNLSTNRFVANYITPDVTSNLNLHNVTEALLDDRYALVATRDIERGEELTNNYAAEVVDPPYYDVIYEQFGVAEDFLDDR
jgi:hypothetical protein